MPAEIVTHKCRQCGEHKPKANMLIVQQLRMTLPLEEWQVEKKYVAQAFDVDDSAFCNVECFCNYLGGNARPT